MRIAGFEPTAVWLKVKCSTIELYPLGIIIYFIRIKRYIYLSFKFYNPFTQTISITCVLQVAYTKKVIDELPALYCIQQLSRPNVALQRA